jgi:hypothetical protein
MRAFVEKLIGIASGLAAAFAVIGVLLPWLINAHNNLGLLLSAISLCLLAWLELTIAWALGFKQEDNTK